MAVATSWDAFGRMVDHRGHLEVARLRPRALVEAVLEPTSLP